MRNFETICRLCGTSEGIKVNIFDPKRTYVSTIHLLLPIMVDERDPWSKLICHRCAFKLEEFYHFRGLCVKTDTYLKTQVSWEQPGISQHIPAEPQNEQIKHEQIEEENRNEPSSTPPPPLSPQIKQESQDMLTSEPPSLTPATAPAPCTQVQANNLQHTSVTQAPLPTLDPLSDTVLVKSDMVNSYLAEEPVIAHSESTADDSDVGFPDSGVSEKMGVDTRTETPRTESRKHKNTSGSVQVSKKKKMPSKHRSRSRRTNKRNSVKSVLSSVRTEDCSKIGAKSNKCEPKHRVTTKAANINDNVLNLRSHAKADTPKKKLMRKPGPKSKVGSRVDDSESDESDVVFVLHKPPSSVLDVIDMTNVSDSPEEEVDESDPEEGLLPHALLTRIPGICDIYTCSCCEGTFTSKIRINNHVCKSKEFNSASPEEQAPRRRTSEDRISGKETCKNIVPEAMASENRASEKKTSDNTVHKNDGSSRGSTSKSTLSSSFGTFSELQRRSYLRRDAASVGKVHSNQDMVSTDSGLYKCNICGFTFSRLVTLMSHKNRHLYRMNDDDDDEEEEEEDDDDDDEDDDDDDYDDDDDDDDYYRCVRKKKKSVAKTVTEDS